MSRKWIIGWMAAGLCLPLVAGDVKKANELLQAALAASDTGKRIELLRKSLDEQPSFAGHYQMGIALRQQSQFAEAVRSFRAALELTGREQARQRADSYYQIGATLTRQGRGSEALAYLRQSYELDRKPAVEKQVLELEKELARKVLPAAELERTFVLASRDLVLDESTGGAGQRVPIWVQFDFDKADLTPTGVEQVRELGQALLSGELTKYQFRVVGHTDLFGAPEYNLTLSRRRAETVTRYLSEQIRLAPQRLQSEGRGMEEPLVKSGSRDDQAVNRRVEVVLVR